MRISTRTPEGQPLECRVCGKTTLVLVSDPPGDSVCPSCGCHAWLIATNEETGIAIVVAACDVSDVVINIGRCRSKSSVAAVLVDGLKRILAPDEIVVWGSDGLFANSRQMIPLARQGGSGDLGFACDIVTQGTALVRRDLKRRFQFGAPLMNRTAAQPIGAIELCYDCKIEQATQDTISRVVGSIAVVASATYLNRD